MEQMKPELDTQGLFRVSGETDSVNRIRREIDSGEIPDFSGETVHTLSSFFKLYFRELPEPLMTYALYSDFINTLGK